MRISGGVINQQTISTGGITEYSLWGSTAAGTISKDDGKVVLGTKFRTNTSGNIVGIRWQRANGSPGVTAVALWQGTTNLSGTQTVSGQTTSGWQRMDFASPVAISASTIYTAAALYYSAAPNEDNYYATGSFFNSALTVGPIEAVATSVSSNGVYNYSTTMVVPTSTYQSACYYIDVVFAA